MKLPRALDPFTVAIVLSVLLATVLPCRGSVADTLDVASTLAVSLLFFFQGAKLSRRALLSGLGHYRLHLLVFGTTFVMFPLLGLTLRPLGEWLVTPALYAGVLFLCALPSTIQSSVVFTSLAGGNVAAAVCSASLSSVLGIVLTPLIFGLTSSTGTNGTVPLTAIRDIALVLLVPLLVGQLARYFIESWVEKRRESLKYLDQGTIVLIVYVAFSDAVVQGLWHRVPLPALGALLLLCALILALGLLFTWQAAKRLGFAREDEIAIVFCGSKKSLATGVPMAKVLFASATVGQLVLPIMLFHQMQLMACAVIARRYSEAKKAEPRTTRD
jgi:sodium/bile acid cotransporter 7